MFPFPTSLSLLLLLLSFFLPSFLAERLITVSPTNDTAATTWSNFGKFLDIQKGSEVRGISELKKYFHRFGYLPKNPTNFTDVFDEHFKSALMSYQSKQSLPITGKLDSKTISQMMLPRCGCRDTAQTKLHTTKRFTFFPGQPRWNEASPMTLTYALSPKDTTDYLDQSEIKAILKRGFTRWATVIPINFTEAEEYWLADIKIGFYNGAHGDGEPFDGVLGVLGHAFSPESGRFHLDAAETWAVDFKSEKSKVAIDLESVVTHEIGHILGLAHSKIKEAVMYASLSPRTKKIDLRMDDVKGVQALYGSNPNFKFSSLSVSDTSSSHSPRLPNKWFMWGSSLVFVLLYSLWR